MRIFKYELETLTSEFDIPEPSKVLTVALQYGRPVVWVAVSDPSRPTAKHRFITLMTGQEYERSAFGDYVGTVQQASEYGELVKHIFHEFPV